MEVKTAIIGEDVDLLVLVTALTPPEQDLLLFKPSHGKVPTKVFSSQELQKTGLTNNILFLQQ